MAKSGGAKLATRVAGTVTRAVIATQNGLVGIKHKLAMAVFHSISDMVSDEVHRTIGSSLSDMHDKLPDDSPAKPLLKFMSQEHGQLQAMVGYATAASGILSSIATIMNNELAPGVYGIVGTNPHLIPDPGTLAQMVAKNATDYVTGVVGIEQNGINSGWAEGLVQMNRQYPGFSDGLELVRRGFITEDQLIQWAGYQGVPTDVAAAWVRLKTVPVTPADAALAVLRGNMSQDDAEAAAFAWGIASDDFNILVGNTGEPLGLEQMLEAFRRGFIDEARLTQGIAESRVRNDWAPTAIQLAYSPMTVSDAVNAVVQNQLDQTTAEGYANQNGLEAGQFQILLNTAGEPLSRTEMEDLFNRGLVTEAQVEQALSESRLKNKYNSLAFQLHTKLLNPSTLADAVLHGSMDQQTAIEKAMELGYSQDDATFMVSAAGNAKMYDWRVKVMEEIVNQYEVNAIDETSATQYITALGFSDVEAATILQAAEYNRIKRIQSAGINAVRSKFVGHRISSDDVTADLQEIGVPSGQIAYLLQIWTVEQSANVRLLTEAQVIKAMNNTLMTQDEALSYLMSMGYSQNDAQLLIDGA